MKGHLKPSAKIFPERIEEEEELEEISAVSTGSVQGTAGNNNDEESPN